MDDLIGGMFALAVAVVVVTLLVAAAVAAFALGAVGGALMGLGQGSVVFANDLGGSVWARGRERREPRPPEPAFQLYILGQLQKDLEAAFKRAWAAMLSFRETCNRFAAKYEDGVTTPLAWGVVAGGYAAPFLGAGLGLLVAAPILLVAALLIAGAWALVWLLRLAESVRRLLRRTAYECPHDHERFSLPVYVCPSCSAEHRDLVPGRWGIFRRECSCESVALPTMVLGGRQRVPQRCPSGHPMSGLIGFAETLRIALVAGPSAGKTTYLAAAMLEFEQMAAQKRFAVNVLEESAAAYGEVVGALRHGLLPQKTQISGNPALVTEIQGDDRSRVLYAYDVAGENYQSADQVRNLRFLEVPSGLILLVDPLSIPRVAEEHEAELARLRHAVLPSPEEPIRVLERTVAALVEGGADPKEVPIAVVIGKTDAVGIAGEIDARRGAAGEAAPRVWLDANGAGNFVRAVEQEFKHVRWFGCSALGRVPDVADRSAYEPKGATEPLLWLLSRRGVVPADRPFEPSRTAERLAGADAAAFAPIGSGGWAWRVAASSLAVVAVLAVLSLGLASLAGLASSGPSAAGEPASASFPLEDEGFSEEESAAEVAPAVNARGFPDQSRPQMTRGIEGVLFAYHQALVDGEFRRAWRLLTARKRAQALREDGYAKWREAQGSLGPYLEPGGIRARVVALEGDGVARVDVGGMGWYAPGASCTEWSGLTWARYEGGRWHYDPGYSTTPGREREWKSRYAQLLGARC
jgi:Double-GTPase 2